MFDPLSYLSDHFQPGGDGLYVSGHRAGFRRGYLVGAWTGVLVAFAFVALTGCAGESTAVPVYGECAITLATSADGQRCDDPSGGSANATACCAELGEHYAPVGFTAQGEVVCFIADDAGGGR